MLTAAKVGVVPMVMVQKCCALARLGRVLKGARGTKCGRPQAWGPRQAPVNWPPQRTHGGSSTTLTLCPLGGGRGTQTRRLVRSPER